jgi:Immunity protein 40
MIQHHIKQKILEKAISLESFGLRDLAWEKESAINLITALMLDDIGILGGDVYSFDLKRLIPTYDNWSCEPEKGELKGKYFLRSKVNSLNYINQYPINPNEKILFSLVFTEIID